MRKRLLAIVVLMLSLALVTHAAGPKTHTVTLGKASTVKLFLDPDEKKPLDIRIRSLFVDARLKEFGQRLPWDYFLRRFEEWKVQLRHSPRRLILNRELIQHGLTLRDLAEHARGRLR